MADVTNNHTSPLTIGGVNIPPKRTAKVEKWDSVKETSTIKTWIARDVISVKEAKADPSKSDEPKSLDDMSKDELLAEAKKLNLDVDGRSSKESVRKAIDDKLAG